MKGRLYDAKLGRFLSADPFVQAPNNTQSYNRYSYVLNNPLSYTDPSGYFFDKIFDWVKDNIRTIAAIAVGFATAGLALGAYLGTGFALTGGGFIGSVIAGAAGAFGGTLAATGSLEAALTAGVFGALSGGLAWQIGHGAIGAAAGRVFGQAGSYIAHGVAQGAVSVLQGGKFKTGFIGGVVGHASQVTKSFIKGAGTTAVIARTMIAASAGGVAASLTGGKFGNGAMSAAFTHLFNNEFDDLTAEANRLEAEILEDEIRLLEGKINRSNLIISGGNGGAYQHYFDGEGNLHGYSVSGAVDRVAPELYAVGAGVVMRTQTVTNAMVSAGNVVLANPVGVSVVGVEVANFATSYYVAGPPVPTIGGYAGGFYSALVQEGSAPGLNLFE